MKKSIALLLVWTLSTALFIVSISPVSAVSKRIVVPDDYPTISSAIGNATNGDTIFVRKGTYEEITITIEKSLSIIGEDVDKTTIELHPPVYNVTRILTQSYAALSNAITINADDFTLSNLTLTLNPDGYIAAIGDRIQITGNNISGTGTVTGLIINGSYCNVTDNVSSGLAGFDFSANTYSTNTTAGGFLVSNGSFNLIARNIFSELSVTGKSNTISNNTLGRLNLSNACQNNISNNLIESSTKDYSLYITGNSSTNLINANILQNLDSDIVFNSHFAMNNTFYHNSFLRVLHESVTIYGQSVPNFWDNGKEGNYWEDYNGTDSNGDGIGDTPYVIDANNVDRYPLMSPWSGDLPGEGFALPQPFLIILAVILSIFGVALLLYLKRRR